MGIRAIERHSPAFEKGPFGPFVLRSDAPNPHDPGMHPRGADRVGGQDFQMFGLGMLERDRHQHDQRCRFSVTASTEKR